MSTILIKWIREDRLGKGDKMMLIQCTKKLLDELKVKPSEPVGEEPLFSWHANLLTIHRRKTLVLMNNQNRYTIVLHGLKAKDWNHLSELIIQAIREVLTAERIADEVVEQYIQQLKEPIFTKTNNKSLIARLNKSCENVYLFSDALTLSSIVQTEASLKVNRLLVGNGNNDFSKPQEEMYRDLQTWLGKPIFRLEAAEIKVTLQLHHYRVWRKLVVPLDMTFLQLHKVLQIAFSWQDYHLHEFYVYNEETEKPIAHLVCDEEAFDYQTGVPMKLGKDAKLSDYFPAKFMYHYDFGDSWEHIIEVENMIDHYDCPYAVCLDGEGSAPPEDVGGESGYKQFLQIVSDPTHPEYQHMRNWGMYQGYQEFDMKLINRRLQLV